MTPLNLGSPASKKHPFNSNRRSSTNPKSTTIASTKLFPTYCPPKMDSTTSTSTARRIAASIWLWPFLRFFPAREKIKINCPTPSQCPPLIPSSWLPPHPATTTPLQPRWPPPRPNPKQTNPPGASDPPPTTQVSPGTHSTTKYRS